MVDDLYRQIADLDFSRARFVPNPSQDEALQEIMEVFGSLAPAVWPQWQEKVKARTEGDLERLIGYESAIKKDIERTLAVGRKVVDILFDLQIFFHIEASIHRVK